MGWDIAGGSALVQLYILCINNFVHIYVVQGVSNVTLGQFSQTLIPTYGRDLHTDCKFNFDYSLHSILWVKQFKVPFGTLKSLRRTKEIFSEN